MTEIFTTLFTTSLSSALVTATRPTTISVAATQSIYGSGTFSIAIYDAGTDASPVHYEVCTVTTGGATTTWTIVTETGYTAQTHANGSTVIATILTPRALQQPLTDHTTSGTTPDPHSMYIAKSNFTAKGDALVGTGAGTFTRLLVGADGTSPIADSGTTSGWRWASLNLASVFTHMGDIVIGGLLGVAQRLGIGTLGQGLVVGQNVATVANPVSGPTCSATGSGGSLGNGTSYDFAFAWETPNASPDGGITLPSPTTTFSATSTGIVAVQAPAAPSPNLTLVVYAAVHSGTYQVQGTLANASTSTTNTINVSSIAGGANISAVNTTGGIGPAWGNIGSVTSVALSAPSEFSVTGSPITGAGTLAIAKGNQSANALYVGPTSGSAAAPTFRAAVAEDYPFCQVNGGVDGQLLSILALTELTTIAASATTTTTIQIPAFAIVLAVSVRVTVVIPTAATFTVIGNTSTTVFNTAAVAVAANTTDPGTAAGAYYNASAQTIRITPNLTPGANTGRVRVTIFYISSTPPTS